MEEKKIFAVLQELGPLTGGELWEKTGADPLPLWQFCRRSPDIVCECIGRRYLRLDKNVQEYARLSPSIRREFLTYTVLGLEEQRTDIFHKANRLREQIRTISRDKMNLAREAIEETVQALADWKAMEERVCFIIAGDVTYDMAHDVPRPEISTGRMVRGSDLDIVAIADDGVPKKMLKALDAAILKKKYYLLVHPNYQEEIDYLVKDISKVRKQLVFDSFQHMIAAKIIHESELLYGSAGVFAKVKAMVGEFGVPKKLALLEQRAEKDRLDAELSLQQSDPGQVNEAIMNLFYTHEEGDEIY